MRILLTNDDGFEAQGLRLLERVAREISEDVWLVAPENEQSGASRAITLASPVRVRQRDEHRFSVSGTPTDCVRIALLDLMQHHAPDLILSGINRGQNVGEDLALSGTVAAAVQGAALGIPSIALSQAIGSYDHDQDTDWSASNALATEVITQLLLRAGRFIVNVNFPACEISKVRGVLITRQGFLDRSCARVERRTSPRGDSYFWMCFQEDMPPADPGTDLAALRELHVSVTPLLVDMTAHDEMTSLGGISLGIPDQLKAHA